MSLMNTLNKCNNRLIENLENPIIKYGFLILVVIKIMVIDYIPTSYLKIYNNIIVKIIYAFVIAYCACFDPIYAIALTTLIIISLQELYSRRATVPGNYVHIQNKINSKGSPLSHIAPKPFIPSEINRNTMSKQSVRYENNSIPSNEFLANDETIFAEINKHTLQKIPAIGDEKLIAEYDYYEDPAFRTITANLKDREIVGSNEFYIMSDDLKKAQQNKVVGSRQSNSIQAFSGSINNIQGLPNGFDPTTK